MQLPKTNRDWLILAPSTILYPLLLVFAALSLPARSTSESLLTVNYSSSPWFFSLDSMLSCKIACEREDYRFASVASLDLFLFPTLNSDMTSGTVFTSTSVIPATTTPFYLSSRTSKFLSSVLNKSLIVSL